MIFLDSTLCCLLTNVSLSIGDLTIEGFTIMIIFKNIFSFGLT